MGHSHVLDYTTIFDLYFFCLSTNYNQEMEPPSALVASFYTKSVKATNGQRWMAMAKNHTDTNPFSRAYSALMMLLVAAPMQTLFARTTNLISKTLHCRTLPTDTPAPR